MPKTQDEDLQDGIPHSTQVLGVQRLLWAPMKNNTSNFLVSLLRYDVDPQLKTQVLSMENRSTKKQPLALEWLKAQPNDLDMAS